jgi:hypothetical protein
MKLMIIICLFGIGCWAQVATPVNSLGPKYMGFFASAMNGVVRGDYITEVQPYSNYVYVRDLTPELMLAKVRKARALGMQSMIDVENVFFPWHSSKLSATWQSDLLNLQKTLQSDKDSVLGFYLFDEPFWVNQQSGWVSVPNDILFKSLESSAAALKAAFPGKSIAMTFAHPEIKPGLLIPQTVDWVGFNCYADYGAVCSDQRVNDIFKFLLRNKTKQQKLILTIDAYWNSLPTPEIESKIISRLELWKKLITSAPQEVAALMPFIYQTDAPGNMWGAESFPQVQSWLKNYSRELNIKKMSVLPPGK